MEVYFSLYSINSVLNCLKKHQLLFVFEFVTYKLQVICSSCKLGLYGLETQFMCRPRSIFHSWIWTSLNGNCVINVGIEYPVSTIHLFYVFTQCWTNVEDAEPELYKCYTNVLCLLGIYYKKKFIKCFHILNLIMLMTTHYSHSLYICSSYIFLNSTFKMCYFIWRRCQRSCGLNGGLSNHPAQINLYVSYFLLFFISHIQICV